MRKFTEAAKTFYSLSIVARQEAARTGDRTLGVEHLFLALVMNEHIAGQTLRSLGITPETARGVIAEQRAEQLASPGLQVNAAVSDHITHHHGPAQAWEQNALQIMQRSSQSRDADVASAILRELIQESSGMINALLLRLHIEPTLVLEQLDHYEKCPPDDSLRPHNDALSRCVEYFIPAPVQEVWDLLSDPIKMPQWLPGIDSVKDVEENVDIGAQWKAIAQLRRPDGSPRNLKPGFRTTQVTLEELAEPSSIAWSFTWPHVPRANDRHIRIRIESVAGGTQLLLSVAWVRNPASRRKLAFLRWICYPITRFALWIQLQQLGASIRRAVS